MIGDNARAITASMSGNVRVARAIFISLSVDYVHETDYLKKRPGVYKTTGLYILRYSPNEMASKTKGKPFLLKVDMFDTLETGGHRVASFEDLCNSQFKDFVPFLTKYTNLSAKLFDIAKTNICCDIPFPINILNYVNDVCEKYKQEHNGEEIENFYFMTENELARRDYMEEEKLISRNNSRNHKIKGVVEKCE